MSSPSWEEIERTVAAVLELPEQERAAWLSQQPVDVRAEPPAHLYSVRRRHFAFRLGLLGDRVGGGREPHRLVEAFARAEGTCRYRRAGSGGASRGARRRHPPSRPQAGQHYGAIRWL